MARGASPKLLNYDQFAHNSFHLPNGSLVSRTNILLVQGWNPADGTWSDISSEELREPVQGVFYRVIWRDGSSSLLRGTTKPHLAVVSD